MVTDIRTALIELGFIADPNSKVISRKQFKANLIAQGKTIKSWAMEHGFSSQEVSEVLTGKNKCIRGKGHYIAIAMGVKADPETLKETE